MNNQIENQKLTIDNISLSQETINTLLNDLHKENNLKTKKNKQFMDKTYHIQNEQNEQNKQDKQNEQNEQNNIKHIKITEKVIEMANKIYKALGTGFSEHIYHRSFEVELQYNSIMFETKKIIPINYRGINVGYGEADLVVTMDNCRFVIELKAISQPPREIEIAQVHTYMNNEPKLEFGLIINFPQPSTRKARNEVDSYYIAKN